MPRYPDDAKEQVRDAVDIADLVGRYTELRRAGPGQLQGLCPFHEERTPSFRVTVDQKFFKCFGCGEGGDVFSFVMKKEGMDFIQSMEWLADRYGVVLEPVEEDPQAAERRRVQARLLEVLDRTATFYSRQLWEAPEAARAREYLRERGLDEGLLREFRVGYSPSAWDTVLLASRRAGYSENELYDAGLVQRSQAKPGRVYDRFRARIMFPLCDRRGRVLGFGARKLGDGEGPKYLNSSENAVFHKGQNIYAADIGRAYAARAQEVILAEGYTDVIALHQAGLRNAVGLMGTALTPEQVGELGKLAPTVLLALDADGAGQEAMLKAARVAAGRGVSLRVVPLPAGLDPADLVQQQGAAAMRTLVERSVPFVRFRVERALGGEPLTSAEAKDRAITAVRPVMADVPVSALREELMALISDRTDLPPSLVGEMLGAAPRSSRPAQHRPTPHAAPASSSWEDSPWPDDSHAPPVGDEHGHVGSDAFRLDPLLMSERAFLSACLAVPEVGTQVLGEINVEEELADPLHRRAAAHLRAHAGAPHDGLGEDADLASLVAELAVRAQEMAGTRAAVDAELAQLRLAVLDRRIQRARIAGDASVSSLASERVRLRAAVDAAVERVMDE